MCACVSAHCALKPLSSCTDPRVWRHFSRWAQGNILDPQVLQKLSIFCQRQLIFVREELWGSNIISRVREVLQGWIVGSAAGVGQVLAMHTDVFPSLLFPNPICVALRPDSYQASAEMAVVVPVCGWWVVFPLQLLQARKRTAAYQALQSGLLSVTAYEKMAALFSRAVPGMTTQEKMSIWAWEISQQFPGPFSTYKYTAKDPFSSLKSGSCLT